VTRRPPTVEGLLEAALRREIRPAAFVLAGHNGSGKSTLWYDRLADKLQLPLINADRLTASILPPVEHGTGQLPLWAQRMRDDDLRWQILSQESVRAIRSLVMTQRMSFAYETVFSHWKPLPGGGFASKADEIRALQRAGYFVVLLFVGLTSPDISILRVHTRKQQGGHDVPREKLISRFPRTQTAVGYAAPLADMTLMFDNSRTPGKAFALVRAQRKRTVVFDARDPRYKIDHELRVVADPWLEEVVGPYVPPKAKPRRQR
jgi:predicted ABC-type ATPase